MICQLWENGKSCNVIPERSEEVTSDAKASGDANTDEQFARLMVKIYRADGIAKPDYGIMAHVRKTLSVDVAELIDPYVQVFFAGLKGTTSRKKHTSVPCWNEQIVFTVKFPLPLEPIVLQLRDGDTVLNNILGEISVSLDKISNPGEKGFLPTFGPCYVYLQPPKGLFKDEDIFYCGRVLMAISTEIVYIEDFRKPQAFVEQSFPLPEGSEGQEVEYFLFACIQDVNMIDRKFADQKNVCFTLQMGNNGSHEGDTDEDSGHATPAVMPLPMNKEYLYLPYEEHKPCMWIKGIWPDNRRRMLLSNILSKMLQKMEEVLREVDLLMEKGFSYSNPNIQMYLQDLEKKSLTYLNMVKETSDIYSSCTHLDRERWKMYKKCIEQVNEVSKLARSVLSNTMLTGALAKLGVLLKRVAALEEDPQPSLPDIVLWMECNGRRVGFSTFNSRRLIYSSGEAEKGSICGNVTNVTLKHLKKKKSNTILARVTCYLWLSLTKHLKQCIKSIPGDAIKCFPEESYEETDRIPNALHYTEKQVLHLRAYVYQARSLPCSDTTSYPNPFATIMIKNVCKNTQVKENTVIPIWNEMLIIKGLTFYGSLNSIMEMENEVIIEIMSYEKSGKAEFLGRTVATIRHKENPKIPPSLEWFNIISTSPETEGQLLAAFELIEVPHEEEALDREEDILYDADRGPVLPIPPTICPQFTKHRVESQELNQFQGEAGTGPSSPGAKKFADWTDFFASDEERSVPACPRNPVLFWGLRELKRVNLKNLQQPRVEVECAGHVVQSSIITNYKNHSNFINMIQKIDMDLPEQEEHFPSFAIKLVECKGYGRLTVVATHIVQSFQKYVYRPLESDPLLESVDYIALNVDGDNGSDDADAYVVQKIDSPWKKLERSPSEIGGEMEGKDWWSRYYISTGYRPEENHSDQKHRSIFSSGRDYLLGRLNRPRVMNIPRKSLPRASIGGGDLKQILELGAESEQNVTLQNKETRALNPDGFVVYPCELENVTPFGGFQDWLHSFDLNRAKKSFRTGAVESQVAVFKGSFRVYKLPLPSVILDPYLPIADSQEGLFGGLPENNPVRVLIRAYIVQAVNLTPTDVTNTCDAYIVIQLGKQKVNDKDHYISKKLNPVFGKFNSAVIANEKERSCDDCMNRELHSYFECFEFVANFPIDSVLQIQLYDWDLMGSDDLIGETEIDLENRFYSRHRPICGIPRIYEKTGSNSWRDALTPTQILSKLCQENRLDGPHITEHHIRIGNVIYDFDNKAGDDESTVENMALLLLHKWQDISPGKYPLTPEHVETRTLYHPSKPGEPQGQLLMWLDMFEEDTVPPSIPRDISIRKPESFELRVIIWNTDEVILADDAFFTGEKMSDIYVKGWLTGKEKAQTTDVHYRSLTGEGNFNWRFIFPFDYLEVEGKMLVMKKVSLFSWDETEFKMPPKLEIEVWDADHFSPDDHLGYLTLDLNRFPRGAKNAASCSLDMLKTDGSVPHLSLFKQHRVKGWWPVIAPKSDKMELTGKVEIELHLLTKEEAEKFPAGIGRKAPDPLEEPKRPETSFLNILHPLKTVRYIFWKNYKWTVIKILMIAALALILLLFLYSAPGYTVKKLLKA